MRQCCPPERFLVCLVRTEPPEPKYKTWGRTDMTTASNDEYATAPISEPTPQSDKPTQSPTSDTRHPTPATPRKPLRLWPGVAAAVLLALAWFVLPIFKPDW